MKNIKEIKKRLEKYWKKKKLIIETLKGREKNLTEKIDELSQKLEKMNPINKFENVI